MKEGPLLQIRQQLRIVQSGFGSRDDWRRALEPWCCRLASHAPRDLLTRMRARFDGGARPPAFVAPPPHWAAVPTPGRLGRGAAQPPTPLFGAQPRYRPPW